MRVPRALRPALQGWRTISSLCGGLSPVPLVLLAGASALTGALEGALLAAVAAAALSLSRGQPQVELSLGILTATSTTKTLLAVALALAVVRLLAQVVVSWLPARIAADVQTRFRRRLFKAYMAADWPVQANEREGHLQTLMTDHSLQVARAILVTAAGLSSAMTLLALLVGAFAISVTAAGLLLLLTGGLLLLLRPLNHLQRRLAGRVSAAGLELAATVSEAARLADQHHIYGTADSQSTLVGSRVDAYRRPFFWTQFIGRLAPSVYQSLAIVLVITGLAALARVPSVNLAAVGTVVLILLRSLSYGNQLQAYHTQAAELYAFAVRARQALSRFRTHAASWGKQRVQTLETLRLEEVSFEYVPERPVLRDVNLTVKKGDAVALVGPSGAGKSTLVQLMVGLLHPVRGRILVNGRPLRTYSRPDWQRLIAYVPQDPQLIHGTIEDNIRFFRSISRSEVETAARAAYIHDEIVSQLGGYGAVIDQRGNTVSGGQRQRICLARALAGQPQFLVLDEPTSALDSTSEELIVRTLSHLCRRIALVVVAHRPALVEVCDQVWAVERQHILPASDVGSAVSADSQS